MLIIGGRLAAGLCIAATVAAPLYSREARAVPSMARQTSMPCATCHTVFPELTPFGRQFKLRGYTIGVPKAGGSILDKLPVAALLQVSRTETRYVSTQGAMPDSFPRDREVIVQGAGLYYGGKITEKSGALVQYFYDGIDRVWKTEMFDVRYAGTVDSGGIDLLYGITLSNSPGVTDIYNSAPMWSFPHNETAAVMPNAATQLDMTLASKVGGPGVYVMWSDLLYAEVAAYRTSRTGIFRPLGWGNERDPRVSGTAPYWRLALQRGWDSHSLSLGTYGLVVRTNLDPEDAGSPTDRFRDIALDGQYQYITDEHQISAQATWIREKQELNASFEREAASNLTNSLRTFRAGAHYFYQRRFGGGIQYFQTRGNADDMRYNMGEPVMGSANGSPNNSGWMLELDWLPLRNAKVALRYTSYRQFNGARANYDGFGRSAADNDSLFLLCWVLF